MGKNELPKDTLAKAQKMFLKPGKVESDIQELIEKEYGKKGTIPKEDAEKFLKYVKSQLSKL